ncbi:MAG: ribonuclease P protein component [Pseudomonadota bacterium]|nr:ribonuclease P protein component [Pseudomonadota bacterium]
MQKRSDFLAANRGRRAATPGFVLLVRNREDGDLLRRVGFTVTRKVGNAVIRNRMKRRFRALAREVIIERGFAGSDHVIIGRSGGIERDFDVLRQDLAGALRRVAK